MQEDKQDIWVWQKSAPACGKHTWIYYHSKGFRECVDCPKRESLWADFGMTKKTEQ